MTAQSARIASIGGHKPLRDLLNGGFRWDEVNTRKGASAEVQRSSNVVKGFLCDVGVEKYISFPFLVLHQFSCTVVLLRYPYAG
jgi:hypothetical protein